MKSFFDKLKSSIFKKKTNKEEEGIEDEKSHRKIIMAIDVYLQIDGIKGESSDSDHKDWIECKSVHFEVFQPKSATASTGGGHTAERCEHKDIVLEVVEFALKQFAAHEPAFRAPA